VAPGRRPCRLPSAGLPSQLSSWVPSWQPSHDLGRRHDQRLLGVGHAFLHEHEKEPAAGLFPLVRLLSRSSASSAGWPAVIAVGVLCLTGTTSLRPSLLAAILAPLCRSTAPRLASAPRSAQQFAAARREGCGEACYSAPARPGTGSVGRTALREQRQRNPNDVVVRESLVAGQAAAQRQRGAPGCRTTVGAVRRVRRAGGFRAWPDAHSWLRGWPETSPSPGGEAVSRTEPGGTFR